jgi:coenzyme F420-reducing hydrogenase gamma subunit
MAEKESMGKIVLAFGSCLVSAGFMSASEKATGRKKDALLAAGLVALTPAVAIMANDTVQDVKRIKAEARRT